MKPDHAYRILNHPVWGICVYNVYRTTAHGRPQRPVVLSKPGQPQRFYWSQNDAAFDIGVSQVTTAIQNGTRVKGYRVKVATKAEILAQGSIVTDHSDPGADAAPYKATPSQAKRTTAHKAKQARTINNAAPSQATLGPQPVALNQLSGIVELCNAVAYEARENTLTLTGARKTKVIQALKDLAVSEAKALGINLSLD